ncbi:uncharacterized protein LOC132600112 [Lycium barbarum]|uniref:uncharacterized protein LOC132600112 n=1 Tax=Lycium barbarum TaxID=112863 RepID=UPI00293E14B7|nr:uncharacterized protein LOC132600112 [Lycium barbarum]
MILCHTPKLRKEKKLFILVTQEQLKFLGKEKFFSNSYLAEIQKLVQSDSSLTNIEVVEKCFGPQHESCVVGFGGGITAKELKDGNSSKAVLLDKLNASEKENESLKRRMDELENKCERMDELKSKYERLASAAAFITIIFK